MANCNQTSTGKTPLFPGIMVPMPDAHEARGAEVAAQVQKVNGKAVVMFVGMSNWRQETAAFLRMARSAGIRHITWHNAGRGAWDLSRMVSGADEYWNWVKTGLTKRNITTEQVQVIFIKNSVRGGAKPGQYEDLMHKHIDRAAKEYPNLRQVFVSSALYSGYSSKPTTRSEPGAWLEGAAVDAVVRARVGSTPWTWYGPYFWADGTKAREDGLRWPCLDFELDGVHPGPMAEAKVAEMLMRFMGNSSVTQWFRGL